jgi:hypothetical protein
VPSQASGLTKLGQKRNSTAWRFVTGLRATLNIPLKGQDESPLSLDRVWGFLLPACSGPEG